MELMVVDGITSEHTQSIVDVEKENARLRRDSNNVRLPRVPFDGMQVLWSGTGQNTKQDPATGRMSATHGKSLETVTHSASSVMTSGSSQTTRPPSDVMPARRFPITAMSVTAVVKGKT